MNPADKVHELIAKIRAKIEELANGINAILTQVLIPGLEYLILQSWEALKAKIDEWWEAIKFMVSMLGDPDELDHAAGVWLEEVGGPVHDAAFTVENSQIAVDDNWVGAGAEQYSQCLPDQKEAMKSVLNDIATAVSGALTTLATAIRSFLAHITAGLWVLLGTIAVFIVTVISKNGYAVLAGLGVLAAGFATCAGTFLTSANGLYGSGADVRENLAAAYAGRRRDGWPQFAL